MQSLQDVLGGRDYTPPDEIELIKNYVTRRHKSACQVTLRRDHIIISVRSSALASTLRLEQERIVEECGLNRRLVFRIG